MTASDHLNPVLFRSVPVPFEEHKQAIESFIAKDPKNATVSVPEEHPNAQSFAVQDQHGNTHGYYYAKQQGGGVYLGGLAATSGAKGISGHVLGNYQHKPAALDGYDAPEITQNYGRRGFEVTGRSPWSEEYAPKNWDYAKRGTPDYIDMERPAMRDRKGTSVSEAYAQLPKDDKLDKKPDYA